VAGMPDAADKEVYYHQLWDAAMNTTMAMVVPSVIITVSA
jgi:hypothetical protein